MKSPGKQPKPQASVSHSQSPFFDSNREANFFFGEGVQREPFFNPSAVVPGVQAKLTVGAVDDRYEQEADQVAADVMDETHDGSASGTQPTVQRTEQEDEDLQMMPMMADSIQQMAGDNDDNDDEPLQRKPLEPEEDSLVQAKGMSGQASDVSSSLETRIQAQQGKGHSLPDQTRAFMEPRFGQDFSSVKVHTDSTAVQLSQELGAQAFTHGQDIYFNSGKYSPGSSDGKALLAHELTHTIQQTGGKVQRKPNKVNNKLPFKRVQREPTEFSESDITEQDTEIQVGDLSDAKANDGSSQNTLQPTTRENVVSTPAPSEPASQSPIGKPVEDNAQMAAQDEHRIQNDQSDGNKQPVPETGASETEAKLDTVNAIAPASGVDAATSANTGNKVISEASGTGADVPETTVGAVAAVGSTTPKSATADPDFQAAVNRTKAAGAAGKKHAPAETKAQEAQAAAISPPAETLGKAQANQVGEMQQAETPGFNKAAFKQQLMDKIKAAAPQTLEDADEFKEKNKLGNVKQAMTNKVKDEKSASQNPLEEKTKQAPNTSGIAPKPVTPLPPADIGKSVASVGANKAIPKPRGQAEVEAPLLQEAQKTDQQMAAASVTEEQLAKSNEPEFKSALSAKQAAKANAASAPKVYRQQEQGELNQAQAAAGAISQQKLQGIHGDRAQLMAQVSGQQTVAKGQDEQARAKVAGEIQSIYNTTKSSVEKILSELDSKVNSTFDAGAAKAQKAFEDYVDKRMTAYKDKRYSGWLSGSALWLKDKLLGMPSEVNAFYTQGRNFYIQQMDGVIDQVVNLIAGELSRAKAEVAKGRQEVEAYIAKQPEDLKAVAQEAAGKIQSQFDSLEQSVDAKQDELIDTLAKKYNEKLKAVDARITQLKAANQGLVDKAAGAITGVIATINKLKTMLLSVLKGAASAIEGIIKDPIGFLGSLISGIKKGFDNFIAKIWEHLQGGLIGWLTGAMGSVGIQLPKDIFSLPGIFDLVMQILGMTWGYVRSKAVKLMGEPVVAAAEKTFEVFKLLQEKGPLGLWEYVKDQFADLKEQVIDSIKNMVITQVITAGVKWILGLLNPASAFVKACMLIYDIVMFFVNQGSQVLSLMKAVVDGVKAIASGSVGAVATAIEGALVKSLPVVIGFLASLLGVSGLAGKVQKIIKKIRGRIDEAINKILLKAKKIFKDRKERDKGNINKDKQLKKGLDAIDFEESKKIENGTIAKQDAQKIAQKVKKQHPIFKSITVIDGGQTWDYNYAIQRMAKKGGKKRGKGDDACRGRLQVQGKDLREELSWPWASPEAPAASAAISGLNGMKGELNKSELALRTEAFAKAERFINNAQRSGGVSAPVSESFQNNGLPKKYKTARVDIEVRTGNAFI